MKYLTALGIILLPLTFFAYPNPPVHFLEGNLAEVRQMAAREGKLYFIHFAADWCMPCQWMEQHTFRDTSLAIFLERNFFALRADVDRQDGQALKKQYGVRILPSLLVFSAQGQLLGRHEGAMEPEALLAQLKAYRLPGTAPKEEGILSSPKPTFALSRPALIPDVEAAAPAAVRLSRPSSAPAYNPASPAGRMQGGVCFTIQVGVFSSYNNAIRHCAALEAKVGHRTEIAPGSFDGQSQYKVFLGQFARQQEAEACLQGLRSKNIDGFVKIIDK
ncbi:MAG: thioredoxin family protein [Lewinellaceae bacterium]|nr:thioredoxin family protein [Phaeodactylibacter sp.]MCB9040134.1 thioredoxin family protein [Lewinellaceae bacterium]